MNVMPPPAPLHAATIVEVGPRDGFQSLTDFVPTEHKLRLIRQLHQAGVRRMEVTSFVSDSAVPQFSDAVAVLDSVKALEGLDAQVLVPNRRHAERALKAGARHLAFVVSVSELHNRSNVNRSPEESLSEYAQISAGLGSDIKLRLNVATSFHCPFTGAVAAAATLRVIGRALGARSGIEVAICDTTGHATPKHVTELFSVARMEFPDVSSWAFHGHDTYGLGVANVLAAHGAGVSVFDGSFAGLGGCPFAPGATGNVATEDLVWTFNEMGIESGLDLAKSLCAAELAEQLPGAQVGGRVRLALAAAARRH
jgi:hydroxymethylglutaryl-CoA lyase